MNLGSETLELFSKFQNFLFSLGLVQTSPQFLVQFRNSFLSQIFFIVLLIIFYLRKKIKYFFILIMSLTIFGQVYFAQKYIPFSNASFVFPKHEIFSYVKLHQGIQRTISIGEGVISPNIPLFFRLNSTDGLSSMYPKRYEELTRFFLEKTNSKFSVSRVGTQITPTSRMLLGEENPLTLKFMKLSGVEYVVKLKKEKDKNDGFNTKGTEKFLLVWENDKWQIFKYKEFFPRYFLTNNYTVIKDDKKSLETLFSKSFDPKKIILDTDPNLDKKNEQTGIVNLITYTPNYIEFKTKSKRDELLYISDNYSKSFKVLVDSKKGTLLRAQYAFRAVPLKKGEHRVVMYFDDSKVRYGFVTALVCLIALTIGVYLGIKKKIIKF